MHKLFISVLIGVFFSYIICVITINLLYMMDLKPSFEFHYHKEQKSDSSSSPVESIVGSGEGWTKAVKGSLQIKPVPGRTTLYLNGAGAMKVEGPVTIGE